MSKVVGLRQSASNNHWLFRKVVTLFQIYQLLSCTAAVFSLLNLDVFVRDLKLYLKKLILYILPTGGILRIAIAFLIHAIQYLEHTLIIPFPILYRVLLVEYEGFEFESNNVDKYNLSLSWYDSKLWSEDTFTTLE